MSLSQKKRKTIDLTKEDDDVCAVTSENQDERVIKMEIDLESKNHDERVGKMEMHLQNMEMLIEGLRNMGGKSAEKSESLMKSLLIEQKELCETNIFNKSLKIIVNDVVNFDDNDSSDDEAPIESIKDENDRKWEIMFQQLRDYRILNGHCKVPANFVENPKLGKWLSNQKYNYSITRTGKGKKLGPEKIAKLESLGIIWGKKYPSPPSWNDMFEKLLAYRQQMGGCNVPFNSTNPSALARWAAYQRMEYKLYKRGQDSLFSPDQIGKLKEIGFNWKGPKL